ncbi:MAG: outer membrane beta-barrel protein, partial [Verrucomicrobia bacterium]|nr:outer membrane beta-barrel protein [Verrucomicrobiota bacterium]
SNAVINDRPSNFGRSNGNLSYLGSVTVVAPESTGFLSGAALYAGIVDGVTGGGDDQTNLYIGGTAPTPVDGLAVGIAYDHINNSGGAVGAPDADILALYASYQATDKMTVHGRVEYVEGDAGLYYGGDDNELLGLTATLDYSLWENVITRLEGRWDQQLDDAPAAYGSSDDIFTLTLNAIYNF